MSSLNIYPWHESLRQQLMSARQQNRLPHALLFKGLEGLGKKEFAMRWAQTLLCEAHSAPCETCSHCHLFLLQSHPDFYLLEPLESSEMIKVDQVRGMVSFVYETPLQAKCRVILIHPAHRMNVFAANALLKILEEPPANVYFLLISHSDARLPLTLLSRCQKVTFYAPPRAIALTWLKEAYPEETPHFSLSLQLAEGAPLKALQMLSTKEEAFFPLRQSFYEGLTQVAEGVMDPLKLAYVLQDKDLKLLFSLLLTWLQDLLRYKLIGGETPLKNTDYRSSLRKMAMQYSSHALLTYLDLVKKRYAEILGALNLNRQLVLEELFIRWRQHATG